MAKHLGILAAEVFALGMMAAVPAGAAESASPGKLDRSFMNEAASGGMLEVELGRYAASHAADDRVKQFGQRMVDDHSKANEELKQVAAQKSVTLPATMSAQQRKQVEETAARLGNTPSVCRKCYVHPAVVNAYLDGETIRTAGGDTGRALGLAADEATVLGILTRRLATDVRAAS